MAHAPSSLDSTASSRRSRTTTPAQPGVFKGCDGGVEVRDASFREGRATSRFFIGDDWGIHSYVVHPFTIDAGGRLTLHEFREALTHHMNAVAVILGDASVYGPFCVLMAARNLRRSEKLKWAFPTATTAALPRGVMIEEIDDSAVVECFYDLVVRAG